jgi:hypothetical protein
MQYRILGKTDLNVSTIGLVSTARPLEMNVMNVVPSLITNSTLGDGVASYPTASGRTFSILADSATRARESIASGGSRSFQPFVRLSLFARLIDDALDGKSYLRVYCTEPMRLL